MHGPETERPASLRGSATEGRLVESASVFSNRVARGLAGILAGLLTGIVELVFLLLAGITLAARRPGVIRVAGRLVALERARLAAWFDHDTTAAAPPRSGYGYLALRAVVGVVGGYVVLAGLFLGFLFLFGGLWALLTGESDEVPLVLPGVWLTTSSWALAYRRACGDGAGRALVSRDHRSRAAPGRPLPRSGKARGDAAAHRRADRHPLRHRARGRRRAAADRARPA